MIFRKPQAIKIEIQANVVWQVATDLESGTYIGVCPALNLNAIGDTWAEFVQCANEATTLLFEDLFKENELEAFLRRNGWAPKAPLPAPGSRVKFDVPFDFSRESMGAMIASTA